jgi:hypothetical protein
MLWFLAALAAEIPATSFADDPTAHNVVCRLSRSEHQTGPLSYSIISPVNT